ncbi:hypothetical protein NBRC110019_05110 [Neptunitalea chrysea]|uniref:DUF3649 domain-containing protein n=1 Tax=Neptunitalea chrysea TaxID=1647581 RepID=A0A9W6EUL0_9FLAO|nr:hypothetical protein [Neptunitalea chrysea]GLB51472.1 hypothetical protein NBRC110019_05110 [Neptunitalea chrysea]
MPANKKYLTNSKVQRIAKFVTGFLGGYLVAMSFYLAIGAWVNTVNVMITSTFTAFLLWVVLFIGAYLGESIWKVLGGYLLITCLFLAIMYAGTNM